MPRALVAALAILLVLPAAAQAGGTASVEGSRLVVTGSPGPDRVIIQKTSTGETVVAPVNGGAEVGVSPGAGCRSDSSAGGSAVLCAAGVTEVAVDLGAGEDDLRFDMTDEARRADLGAGDDYFEDVNGGSTVALGDGDDEVRAGRGEMNVEAGSGNDELFCKDGSSATRDRGMRQVDGGAGKDRICGGRGDDELDGGTGDDKIYAGEGDDTIDGDAGDDLIEGGDENDRITGGRGEDEIEGGSGKDTIRVRDREVDEVACGSKKDTVVADRSDDLSRCETVRLG